MKSLLIGLVILGSANLSYAGPITCSGSLGDYLTLSVEATLNAEWLQDVTATTQYESRTVIGRSAQLSYDKKYNPRKYINHYRYDLSKLTEVSKFGKYLPADMCVLNFLVPEGATEQDNFTAVVIANCDQSGGTFKLACTHDRSRDRR